MAEIIDGRQLAKEVNQETKQRVDKLLEQGIQPGIVVILVGDDPASEIYTRNKHRKATKLGFKSILKKFPADVDQATVMAAVEQYNADDSIDGILVQEPLPDQLDGLAITNAIRPDKDVDGLHPLNLGKLYANQPGHYPVACTPRGVMTMFDRYNVELEGKNAVIVGRSILVGKPMAALLNNANATTCLTSIHTVDLPSITRQADILIVAAGSPHLIKEEDVKEGAVVIDVGINRLASGKLTGDVDFENVSKVAKLITPVPGGVGPMTIASLMQQTVDMAEWRHNG
ncbi:bifunctional methylenetetrahydrofolate dehydrogenase/methenyltetrahydrofolate cyclohydrolase FolD [Limosilactobacillus sp.]|jgi:methylenetetrahydrofolate dehydrogenase (NADP+)/methenyltetrahydrofolate cyclohydrolase|uniref:bifunctional methylenetetrahydrofolate dehydrogenase/methenyltetrahydrofolate cyclohydrolase FolD n=1 Tax=Limosilactobacillus sp. TaxID=2773925 RepID=UPI0025B7C702|nr:bifunctional methylenetetrahydrofolate dehydrogenase/methenyltetrahydrofolate cyclohydrolase FolD [Limosilactobacillus sp.]MCH3923048.1 bifunctional methylenetetrahydrofolate dehydrogenase/methenyltetrahydrofolate cyclohydrolase FolD [Limosilactobacillus sp.]MCH3927731.1 bifunctional methylenetetrahydrofolate dehydrogenase/methenyltetrahydrofolate cyclohydrolase FolD [Limosilactobacillus sp.]